MEYIQNVTSNVKPPECISCATGTRYSFNVRLVQDEEGEHYVYEQYWFPIGEYELVQNGILPEGASWTAELHRIFREYQHQRADNLYVYAQRMFRSTSDAKYSAYITSLDAWNAQVSALATAMSTDVPDLPVL